MEQELRGPMAHALGTQTDLLDSEMCVALCVSHCGALVLSGKQQACCSSRGWVGGGHHVPAASGSGAVPGRSPALPAAPHRWLLPPLPHSSGPGSGGCCHVGCKALIRLALKMQACSTAFTHTHACTYMHTFLFGQPCREVCLEFLLLISTRCVCSATGYGSSCHLVQEHWYHTVVSWHVLAVFSVLVSSFFFASGRRTQCSLWVLLWQYDCCLGFCSHLDCPV